jgi:hypothetical protein
MAICGQYTWIVYKQYICNIHVVYGVENKATYEQYTNSTCHYMANIWDSIWNKM